MNEPQRIRQTVAGLFFLCFLLYFWELGQIPFYNYEESKEALVVWEMVNGGGWILPLRNGEEIPLKPPLFHWCGALIGLISGKANEFAVRSPSAFFSTASVFMIFFFGRRFWSWRVGLLAALVTATSPEWVRWATYARSDMAMVFFLTAAGFMFFRAWEERGAQRRTLYLLYLFIGLATLAKGPLGIVLPGLVSLTFLLISRDLRFLGKMRLIEGTAIVLVVAVSWYALALEQAGWEFFRRQILNENLYRFFESEQGGPSRDHAWYYYAPALVVSMFPWSLFFPALIHFFYRSREALSAPKLRYLLVWFVAGLIFFTLASGKRTNYLLPLYPPLALLFAVWWEALVEGESVSSVFAKRLARINAIVPCTIFVLIFVFLIAHSAGFDLDHIVSPFLHPRDRENLPIVAYSLQNQFSIVVIWLLLLALATAWYFWGLRKNQWMYVFSALVVVSSSSLYFANALFHPLLAWERTYKPFMLGVRSTVKNAPLFFYKDAYDYGATFYANRHIPSYDGDLSTFQVDGQANAPQYLLLWEEDWQAVSATDPRLEHLVTSEGRGPDKKHRLVLAAIMPGRPPTAEAPAGIDSPPSSTPPTHPDEAPAPAPNAEGTPNTIAPQEAPPSTTMPATEQPPAAPPAEQSTIAPALSTAAAPTVAPEAVAEPSRSKPSTSKPEQSPTASQKPTQKTPAQTPRPVRRQRHAAVTPWPLVEQVRQLSRPMTHPCVFIPGVHILG